MNTLIKIFYTSFLIFIFIINIPNNLLSQPVTEWVQRYNSPGNFNDDLIDMVLDKEGNTYITGNTGNPLDILTLKYSNSGNLLWSRIYNGPANRDDEAVKIAIDDSGFVYVAGKTFNTIDFTNYLLLKYSNSGNLIFVREYNYGDSTTEVPRDMVIDNNSNIIIAGDGGICGLCPSDYLTVKYDKNGNVNWVRRYHGEGYFSNLGWTLALDNLGRVIVSGRSRNINNSAITATVIYDSSGKQLNVMLFDSSYVNSIKTDNYNNIYIGGFAKINNINNSDDIFITKYDSIGNFGWSVLFYSPNALMNHSEYLRDMRIDKESKNIYITGYGDFNGLAGWEYPLMKYKTDNGDSVWIKYYSPIVNSSSGAECIAIDKFNNTYITGSSDYNTPYKRFLTVKYDSAGNFIWAANYLNILFFNNYGKRVLIDSTNSVFVGGTSYGPESGSNDIVLIKYSQITNVESVSNLIPEKMELFQNYPNPFNPITNIQYQVIKAGIVKIKILNILGKEIDVIVNESQQMGKYTSKWDGSKFSSGIYFYNLEFDGNIIDTKKLILLK